MNDITTRKGTNVPAKATFGALINQPKTLALITSTLGSEIKSKKFVTAITSAVANNSQLQECEFNSILTGALLGESLNLSPAPQLQLYHLVPYNCKVKLKDGTETWVKKAQFQLGYKGYIQLAERSGQYKHINVVPIKKGEIVKVDRIKEIFEFNPIEDDEVRENTETVGYYAYFEYHNGFKKETYWSKEKVLAHAKKFSKTFSSRTSVWNTNEESMSCKTVLRNLLSKWAIMSIDMQKGYIGDQAVINDINNDNLQVDYVDNDNGHNEVIENEDTYNHDTGVVESSDDYSGYNIDEEDKTKEPKEMETLF